MSFTQVILVGNVGRDPELRYTPGGMAVCHFSMAVNRSWTDRGTNERKDETTWWRITFWGNQAETINQYVTKGKQLMVIGDRVHTSTYAGQDGQTRVTLELTAREFRFLGNRSEGGGDQYESGGNSGGNYGAPATDVDDIPF